MLPLGPYPPLSQLKNTWCKLTLASRERKGRKTGKGIGQREEQTREEEISRIAVRSEECLHFVPWSPLPHTALKTTATSPQAAISSGSPAAALQSHTDPLTFCTCATAWLTASFIYSPSLNACWSNVTQVAHICSCFEHERGISFCLRTLICNFASTTQSSQYMWTGKHSPKHRNQESYR